jgi:hypothetical protein
MEMPTRQVPRRNNNSNTKARSMAMANFFVVLIQIQAAVLVLVLMGSLWGCLVPPQIFFTPSRQMFDTYMKY